MNKKTPKQNPAKKERGEVSGKVCGIRAVSSAFSFDVTGKGGRVHTFTLDGKQGHMVALVIGAHASRKKLHVTTASGEVATALRLGEAPKVKKQKPVIVLKSTSEAAAPPAAESAKQ